MLHNLIWPETSTNLCTCISNVNSFIRTVFRDVRWTVLARNEYKSVYLYNECELINKNGVRYVRWWTLIGQVINAYVFSGDLTFVILKFGNNNSTIIFCWTFFDNLLNDNVFNKKELQLYKRGEVVYLSVENFTFDTETLYDHCIYVIQVILF